MTPTIYTTVEEFCRLVYGCSAADMSRGTYPGTDTPRCPLPADALLVVEDHGVIIVTDLDGGWIADRLCGGIIGRREWKKLCEGIR